MYVGNESRFRKDFVSLVVIMSRINRKFEIKSWISIDAKSPFTSESNRSEVERQKGSVFCCL